MRAAWVWAGVCAVALGFATPARAELDKEEKAFFAQCIKRMNAKSDRLRAAVDDALHGLGIDVLDALAEKSTREGDTAWTALERLAVRFGRPVSAAHLQALALRTENKARQKRVSELAQRLRPPMPEGADPEVTAAVDAILDGIADRESWGSDEPEIAELVEIGRGAFPVLLARISERMDRHESFGRLIILSHAIRELAEPGDAPTLRAPLLADVTEVADALGKLVGEGDPDALPVLHEAVSRGVCDSSVCHALEKSTDRAASSRALVNWLKDNPEASSNRIGFVAEALGRLGQREAGDALVELIASVKESQEQEQMGAALLKLGRKEGFPLLLLVAARPDTMGSLYRRLDALHALERTSGVSTEASGKDTSSWSRATAEVNAKIAAAVKVYSEWWKKNRDGLVYDAAAGAWRVD